MAHGLFVSLQWTFLLVYLSIYLYLSIYPSIICLPYLPTCLLAKHVCPYITYFLTNLTYPHVYLPISQDLIPVNCISCTMQVWHTAPSVKCWPPFPVNINPLRWSTGHKTPHVTCQTIHCLNGNPSLTLCNPRSIRRGLSNTHTPLSHSLLYHTLSKPLIRQGCYNVLYLFGSLIYVLKHCLSYLCNILSWSLTNWLV